MYLRLTSRCNMHCAHCGFAATARGRDMSTETFEQCLVMLRELKETAERVGNSFHVTLGGGEPTIHPRFEEFLFQILKEFPREDDRDDVPFIGIVTNGSQPIAEDLAYLASRGAIHASLSRTQFHDAIPPLTEEMFRPPGRGFICPRQAFLDFPYELERKYDWLNLPEYNPDNDHRSVIGNLMAVTPIGRGASLHYWVAQNFRKNPKKQDWCIGAQVEPSGKVYACHCRKTKLGDNPMEVNTGMQSPVFFEDADRELIETGCYEEYLEARRQQQLRLQEAEAAVGTITAQETQP